MESCAQGAFMVCFRRARHRVVEGVSKSGLGAVAVQGAGAVVRCCCEG